MIQMLPACVHVETRNGLLGSPIRTRIDFSAAMVLRSGVLNRIRRSLGLSYAQLDVIAQRACGRRWCMFRGLDDYDSTIHAALRSARG